MSAPAPVPLPLPPSPAAPLINSRIRARLRFWATFLFLIGVVGAAGAGVYRYRAAQPAPLLPPAPPRQGDFFLLGRCPGDLKTERSLQIYTPNGPHPRRPCVAPPRA